MKQLNVRGDDSPTSPSRQVGYLKCTIGKGIQSISEVVDIEDIGKDLLNCVDICTF